MGHNHEAEETMGVGIWSVFAARGGRRSIAVRALCVLTATLAAAGCYVQQPLPREPTYVPASWEPILGLTTRDGDELDFDEPATLEGGRVVYRIDGSRGSVSLGDVQRLMVGRKTLDKLKTILFSAVFLAAFGFFFASIGTE